MKKWTQYVLFVLLGLTLVGSAAAVSAQGNTPPQPQEALEPPPLGQPPQDGSLPAPEQLHPQPHPPHSLRGEVTAVYESGLTILTPNERTVEVNVHSGTKIWLVETLSQGSLDDVEVGDDVRVEGCRCGESSVGAQRIVVEPDGDAVHGRVTAVEGSAIQLENAEGSATVLTSDATAFRIGRKEAALEDVAEGMFLVAFGQLQPGGSLNAELVIVHPKPKPPVRNVRGEVTAVSAAGLTMSVPTPRDEERDAVSVQVNASQETKVWLVESESQGSLADIEVGNKVVVRGTRAEGSTEDEPAMQALHIAVGPGGDEVRGRVTAVEGAALTLETREGEVTVRTDSETSFRKGRQVAALEDAAEGAVIVASGELHADGSLDAEQVYIQRDAPPPPPGGPAEGQPPAEPGSAPRPGTRQNQRQS